MQDKTTKSKRTFEEKKKSPEREDPTRPLGAMTNHNVAK